MNDSRFAFTHQPFPALPQIELYVDIGASESIRKQCIESIRKQSGPTVILGGAGLGKTMTCMRIKQSLSGLAETIFLSSSQIASRADLLKSLLYELRMPYRGLFDGELRLSLIERLQHRKSPGSDHVVLIVDEAQALSPRLLEELRLLTNITVHGKACLSLILCGSLKLEEMLCNPQLESLQQRITARHFLKPFNHFECTEYIRHRIELAGVNVTKVFDESAIDAIFLVSNGIPRLIDQIADRALTQDDSRSNKPLNATDIERAWQSSQHATLPWVDSEAIPLETEPTHQRHFEADHVVHSDAVLEVAPTEDATRSFNTDRARQDVASESTFTTPVLPIAPEKEFADSDLVGWTPDAFSEAEPRLHGTPPSAGMGLSFVIEDDEKRKTDKVENLDREFDDFNTSQVTEALHKCFDDHEFFSAQYEPREQSDQPTEPQVPVDVDSQPLPVFSYGVRAPEHDPRPFDLQPTTNFPQQDIEENLFEMISNMNLESISIDPFFELNTLDSQGSSVDKNIEEVKQPLSLGVKSFFGQLEDDNDYVDVDELSQNSFQEATSAGDDPSRLQERLSDLESIANFSRSSSLAIADMEEQDMRFPFDDRDIITVEEDIVYEQDAAQQPVAPKPVTQALMQSYAKIFSDLRG